MAFAICPARQGAAAEFAQDPRGLELGVGAFSGGAELGVGGVGSLLGGGRSGR
jgi:hypothetical protein